MHRIIPIAAPVILSLLLAACLPQGGAPPAGEIPPPPAGDPGAEPPLLHEEDLVTRNVAYTGILEEGGVTIYQQGTHRLTLNDGRMVLLKPAEGAEFTLGPYVGKLVRVEGDVSPTVEAGGTIMEVKEIAWIRRETDGEGKEMEVLRVLCGEGATCPSGFICELAAEGLGVCMEGEEGEEGEERQEGLEGGEGEELGEVSEPESEDVILPARRSSQSEGGSERSDSEANRMAESEPLPSEAPQSGAKEDKTEPVSEAIALMLNEDYAPERWTQTFCFKQMDACVDGHMNWYFKSFGAMSTVLGHAEIGPLAVNDVGDGPIAVDMKTGGLEALGVADFDVKEVGGEIIGYRSWTENRHFEISADPRLREPVKKLTENLRASKNE